MALKALSLLLLHKYENQETSTKKGRKHWVWPWPGNRQLFGCYSLLQETKRDTKAFRDFIRMEESQFEYLVEALTPIILKEDRNMTECIIPHEMVLLSITLFSKGRDFLIAWIPVSHRKEDYILYWCLSSYLWDPRTTLCKYAQKH